MWDFPAFINELESDFGPHDPIGDAEKALTELTMKENSHIIKYNVEFWKLASKLDWNESALCARYFRGLPLRLRVEVLRDGGKPTHLASLRLKAQEADDNYWMVQEETRPSPSAFDSLPNSKNRSSTPSFSSPPDSENESAPQENSESTETPNPVLHTPKPQLDSNGKLTSKERERCMKQGICLYCGEDGHLALACPKSAAAKIRAAALSKAKTNPAEIRT